jgi:hypothetical protein
MPRNYSKQVVFKIHYILQIKLSHFINSRTETPFLRGVELFGVGGRRILCQVQKYSFSEWI